MKYTSVVLVCIIFVVPSLMITDFFYCLITADKMIIRQCLRIVFYVQIWPWVQIMPSGEYSF